jgi:hypothetical protein
MDDNDLASRLEDVPGRMGTATRALATVFVVLAIAFWLFAFSPWARDIFQAPDQIADETLVAALDNRCAAARALLTELPLAQNAASPEERASVLTEANIILGDMAADLAELDGGTNSDQRLVSLWLADWDIYLGDRETHVGRLVTEGDIRFLTTEENGVFINERMDGFARVNDLDNCETPGDV